MSRELPISALKRAKGGRASEGSGVYIKKEVEEGPDLLSTCIFWGLMGYDI